jgi:hypothetical protein
MFVLKALLSVHVVENRILALADFLSMTCRAFVLFPRRANVCFGLGVLEDKFLSDPGMRLK